MVTVCSVDQMDVWMLKLNNETVKKPVNVFVMTVIRFRTVNLCFIKSKYVSY